MDKRNEYDYNNPNEKVNDEINTDVTKEYSFITILMMILGVIFSLRPTKLENERDKKKYVVSRSNRKNVGKSGRNVKFVDRRLKKDTKSLKRAEKRNKKKGVSKPHGKGKKAGRKG